MLKVRRNEPCPCGSGKKHKHCCGALTGVDAQVPARWPEQVGASGPTSPQKDARIAGTAPRLEPISDGGPRPFWTVIVPLYERRSFLKQCLDSVLDQGLSAEDMEIVVIDDASPSDLREFVEDLGRTRVTYVRNASNIGLYPSTNAALRRARGRWIHILHDDDWVLPAFYSTMRAGIENAPASVGVAFCMYVSSNERDGTTWSPPPFRSGPGTVAGNFCEDRSGRSARSCRPLSIEEKRSSALAFSRGLALYRRLGMVPSQCTGGSIGTTSQKPWPVSRAREQSNVGSCTPRQTARDVRLTLDIFRDVFRKDVAMRLLPEHAEFHARRHPATASSQSQAGDCDLAKLLPIGRRSRWTAPCGRGRNSFDCSSTGLRSALERLHTVLQQRGEH